MMLIHNTREFFNIINVNALKILAALFLSLVAGVTVAFFGILGLVASLTILVVVMVLISGDYWYFWLTVMFILFGYMFLGKGFAYVGVFPLYIGEATIGLGVLILCLSPFLSNRYLRNIFKLWVIYPLILFLLLSVLQTIPYFSVYKIAVIRDAMLYGYAIFAFLIGLFVPKKSIDLFMHAYQKLIPIFLLIAPVVVILSFSVSESFPLRFPGAPVPIFFNKAGDIGVHLGGVAAFILLRLDKNSRPESSKMIWIYWMLWGASITVIGSISRGGILGGISAVAVVVLLRPRSGIYKPILLAILVLWLAMVSGLYSLKLTSLPGHHREVSVEQVVNNLISFVGKSDDSYGGLKATVSWRFQWWESIIDYTFNGPYFWTGKGYGINLGNSDGFQADEEEGLERIRSPHNVFMTILARSGVPGFIMWLIFLLSYYVWLVNISFRRRLTNSMDAQVAIWFMAYTVAMLANGSFDVYIEGPMGGIWFWSIIGISFSYFSAEQPLEFKSEKLPTHSTSV